MKRYGILLAVALLAGCGGSVDSLSFPTPPSSSSVTSTTLQTLPPGLDNVAQDTVPGQTTVPSAVMGPGAAVLNGTVVGPAGPVSGATVEIDRFVGDSNATAQVTTKPDGSWSLPKILGGRYRVRAWQSPGLDMVNPQIFYMSNGQHLSLTLQVSSYTGPNISVAINPPTPYVDQPLSLLVQVTNPVVGSDGVITNSPVAGSPVTLVNGGAGWDVMYGNPLTTNSSGQALFEVACTTPGVDPLSAQLASSGPVSLDMPACSEPPPPTTTTTTTTTTTLPSTTSTSCPTTTTVLPGGRKPPGPPAPPGC